jgi:hypothetical protein
MTFHPVGYIPLFILVVALAALASGRAATDTPFTIIERAIKAHGGRQALQRSTDIVWRAPVNLGFLKGTVVRYFKWPDKLRLEMSVRSKDEDMGLEFVHIYDGKRAWEKLNTGFREHEPLRRELSQVVKRNLHMLLRYRDPGVRLQYLGQEMIEDQLVDGVTMQEDGDATTLYFDVDSGLLTGMQFFWALPGETEPIDTKLRFFDFVAVGDVRMAGRIAEYRDGRKRGETRFSSIRNDRTLPDDLFTRPIP